MGCSSPTPVEEVSVTASGVTVEEKPLAIAATDWPFWRGPQRNGVAAEQEVVTNWDDKTNIVWSTKVPGRGHASPVVAGEQIFLATALEDREEQCVVAFDRNTGKQQWQKVIHQGGFTPTSQMHNKSTHANGTVACDGEHVYCAFLNHGKVFVSAVDLQGEIVWQREVGPFDAKFGYAPSPVLFQSFVIVAADNRGGGYLAALERDTGEIAWRKQRPAISSYSSPLVAEAGGRDQLLISGCHEVAGYDPATGDKLWAYEGAPEATCGTVVTDGTLVFASGGYPERQTVCVKADSGEEVWSNNARLYEPSLLLTKGLLFCATDDGIAYCWSAATGEEKWRKRLGGSFSASPVLCGDQVFVTNASGTTFVFAATGEQYEQIAENHLGDDTYASPAICGGRIYLRVGRQVDGRREETLYCLGL